MQYIQILLIVVGFIALVRVLSGRGTHAINAWKKIAVLLLVVLMVLAVLAPNLVTQVAHTLGVGRGTDLLTYVLFSAFLFYVLGQYVRSQDEKDRLFRLARQVAILEAKGRYDINALVKSK